MSAATPSGKLAGKVALVTGGGGAIGAAVCRTFAAEGASVIVADVQEDAAVRVAASLPGARALQLDVTSSSAWNQAARAVGAQDGGIDILVNGAATHVQALVEQMSDGDWDRVMRTNADSVFFGCRAVLPLMRARGSGSIVNVVTGQFGVAYSSAYTSSKFLVYGFSQCLVLEVARYGIRVNCIAPGSIPNTGFERWYREKAALLGMPYDDFLASALDSIPLHRFGVPEDIAAGALYLASDDASYVTGQLLNVDGGFSGYSIALAREES